MTQQAQEAALFVAGHPDKLVKKQNLESQLLAGEVIVARGGEALSEIVDTTRDEIFKQIEEIAGSEARAKLENSGLTRIHEFLPVSQVEDVHERATENLRAVYMEITERLIRELTGRDAFYINHNFVLRFYMPNEIMSGHYSSLKKRPGKLVQHGPHLDLWQNVAVNALNIWIAIEDVDEGNGMVVFKDAYGKTLPRGGEHVRDDQIIGEPTRLPCKAGDMLLFHSQHLHGGVLNRTDMTRVAITTRFSLDTPKHPRFGTQLHYASAESIRSQDDKRIRASYLLDKLRPRNLAMRVESKLRQGRPGDEQNRLQSLDSWLGDNWIAESQDLSRAAGKPDPDRITIVDKKTIEVEDDAGNKRQFQRRCPHMGADLACGYIKDNHIWCPWHDQGFSLEDGSPAGECSGLPALKCPSRENAD